ncbi:MAG TPA: alpha/beta fold hydrolase [Solirubrobacteraceae bacterium]|nr:alpha/beta fold hydrolase [Solirubrobacteraceae bacterium]
MRVSVGDAELYFEVFGQGRSIAADAASIDWRPTLIGLHGGPGLDGTKLRYILSTLADIAQVVVPDQRGHGLSDYGSSDQWNLAQWAADVKALADALGIEEPIVLGESFGGFVAQQYASSYPDHAAALIIVSSGPRFVREDEIAARTDIEHATEVARATRRVQADQGHVGSDEWETRVEPLLRSHPNHLLDRVDALRARWRSIITSRKKASAWTSVRDLRMCAARLLSS